jgi:hypothetical protein
MPVKILDFPKIVDPRGSLTFLQNPQFIPFEIERVFWLLNVAENKNSVGYACEQAQFVIIALNGSFDVVITNVDGSTQKYSLTQSHQGLYVPVLTWMHIENCTADAIGLYLSSEKYNAANCITELETFKNTFAQ